MKARGLLRLGLFAATTAHHGLRLVAAGNRLDAHARARITHEWGLALCRACGIRVEIDGELPAGGALLVSNHRSYADIAVLASCSPLSFVAKSEVAAWPILGWASRRAGTIFVRREDARSGAVALRALRKLRAAGVTMVVFPEGTTLGPPGIGPLQLGIFRLAARARTSVVPVAIEYERPEDAWTEPGDASFAPHFVKCFARPTVTVRVRFGPALHGDDAELLRASTGRWITDHLAPPHAHATALSI